MIWISAIEPREVPDVWPHIVHHIEASQRRGPSDMSLAEIRHLCVSDGSWRLLVFDNCIGAAVIRILDGNLHVVAVGGKMERGWLEHFVDWLVSMAHFFGHPAVTLGGRKGWQRRLKPLGFVDLGGGWMTRPVPPREIQP